MKFIVSKDFFEKVPNAYFGVVIVKGFDNKKESKKIKDMLSKEMKDALEKLKDVKVKEEAYIIPYREAFKNVDINPNKFLCSIEALLTRISKGKDLPSINPIVDLGNALSVKYKLPIGVHDIDNFKGDIEVRKGKPTDTFVPFGGGEVEHPEENEYVYVSGDEIKTRKWTWRQGEKSKITEDATNIFIPIDGFEENKDEVLKLQKEIIKFLKDNYDVEIESGFVDKNNPIFEWDMNKKENKKGEEKEMKLYDELKWRGLIKDEAGADLEEKLNAGGMTFYIGADPSADSLHIGQYPTFIVAERLRRGGHNPIILVGGATGRVGDPRGTGEREKRAIEEVEHNFKKLTAQMKKLFGEKTIVVDNHEWFKDYNYVQFLRDVGKAINVSYMINKDLVKRQMEVGISYAEFSYMLMQGYDFKYLHDNYGVDLQFGGSDQWGNLTTGIELIRKLNGEEVYAFSVPLLTDSTGKKLGKSYGNALWIDREKTSPYELYQYLLNFEDVMVEEYIKKYTFLSKEEIEKVLEEHNKAPEKRLAQRTIAEEVVRDLHGQEALDEAIMISEALFSGNVKDLTDKQIEESLKSLDHFEVEKGDKLIDILTNTKITSSRRETRELLEAGAITINGEVVKDENMTLDAKRKYNIVRRGKKKYYILKQK